MAGLIGVATVQAQDALREASAIEKARAAREKSVEERAHNLKLGPVLLRFDAIMGFEFNDNPTLAEDETRPDVAFKPLLDIESYWPITRNNTLSLGVGIGYTKFVRNPDLDYLHIAPDSELSYDLFVGNWTINLHDRLTQTQDPINEPTVSGTGEFAGIENVAGVRFDWDLNEVRVNLGYDHFNFFSTANAFSNAQDRASEYVYLSTGYLLNEAWEVGLDLAGGTADYEKDILNDHVHYSIGPYLETQLTRHLRFRTAAGYVRYDFDTGGRIGRTGDHGTMYADARLEHRINQWMRHTLSIGREIRPGTTTDLLALFYLRYMHSWTVIQNAILHSSFFYERGNEYGGQTESLSRYGGGLALSYPIMRKLTGTVGYQGIYKDSNRAGRDYLQNRLTLELTYEF